MFVFFLLSVFDTIKGMNCNKAEKLIPSFISDELDINTLQSFVEHIEGCNECREELSIQFLVSEGMLLLETGDSFDLQSGLNNKLSKAHLKLRIIRKLTIVRNVFLTIVMLASVVFGILVYLYK